MKSYSDLLTVIRTLRGTGGCPWDREQTIQSLAESLIEETYELVEAIDSDKDEDLEEEMGDLLFLVTFLAYIGEQDGRFTVESVLDKVSAKLIRRHPHVFGDTDNPGVDGVLQNWEQIKLSETKNKNRKTLFDGIPKGLPEIQRFFKILEKIRRGRHPLPAVETDELRSRLNNYNSSTDYQSAKEFIRPFLLSCFHNKIDLNKAIREISSEQMSTHLKNQE